MKSSFLLAGLALISLNAMASVGPDRPGHATLEIPACGASAITASIQASPGSFYAVYADCNGVSRRITSDRIPKSGRADVELPIVSWQLKGCKVTGVVTATEDPGMLSLEEEKFTLVEVPMVNLGQAGLLSDELGSVTIR